jgi:hypothetical protein
MIVYRATVTAVSSTDVTLEVEPAKDGEEPITPRDGFNRIHVNVPGATNGDDIGPVLRAFGALIGIKVAVRITIEPNTTGLRAHQPSSVHILHEGQSPCSMSFVFGVPGKWPDGHTWVGSSLGERSLVTCQECLSSPIGLGFSK